MFLAIVCEVGSNYWINVWTSGNHSLSDTSGDTNNNNGYFLGIYVSAIVLYAIFTLGSTLLYRVGLVRVSALIHSDLLNSVMRTPLSFFDVTPTGRIINRFNRDIEMIGLLLPWFMYATILYGMQAITIMAVIVYTIPIIIVMIVIVAIVFAILYRISLWTTRQLNRMNSITRSPIYSHFNESIAGAVSIRAYKTGHTFTKTLQKFIDTNLNVQKHTVAANMCVSIWTAIIGSFITFSAALFVVLKREDMTPGLAGFVLIYSFEIITSISWALRFVSETETEMVCVERIREYSQLEPEFSWDSPPESKPPDGWPLQPSVEFIDYTAAYRPGLQPVLKGLNFKLEAGERVGIVGRTGAGKSSMTLAMFRIIEPTTGRIVIDGVDVTRIGLHDLRSKLTIIPQEPNLFAGTLRLNLDPFDNYSDQQLWTALERAHLKDFIAGTADGLSYEIAESGDNLSAGQRQLVCLARALLRDTKILVLDEATAACDLETDSLIQSTIRDEFTGSTVLTIAHRLNTVLDYNRVIVLDKGVIVETDSPNNLLQNPDSVFYGLAKEFGIV
ncbi:unnamed protein product [Medioppia subpectinata]|uniref:Uncharacterized protein n=1 Tax=Medioppia subpectinata TaxID=1979941 RepID=A0A7R9KII4_9ACAR|nr:unnamed protein product [Medioppia subpectinata]CAG2102975.1 unnamed protein product [Medioppia subpectinata]